MDFPLVSWLAWRGRPALARQLLPVVAATLFFPLGLRAENLLPNGEFTTDTKGWSLFVPRDAQGAECQLGTEGDGPEGHGQATKLSSTADARYGIGAYPKGVSFGTGDRYRVTVWIKAGEDFQAASGTPGFVLRVTFFADGNFTDAAGGHFYLTPDGHAAIGSGPVPDALADIPKTWTKVEGVFEMPPDAVSMNVSLFVWKGTGSLYVGDVSLEPVDKTTPVSAERVVKN